MRATTLSQAPAGQPNFMPPAMQMMQMITGCWVSQSIYAAARLGIADQLKTGPKSYTELATKLPMSPGLLLCRWYRFWAER
jgi:hypothetical protein